MMNRSRRWGVIVLALAAGVAASCASTSQDVDVTPTVRITADAHIGKSWTSDSTRIENISDDFTAMETVYLVVDVPGRYDGSMRVRWTYAGTETIQEQTVPLQDGTRAYAFRMTPPAAGWRPGEYQLEVYINNDRVDSERFSVSG